MITRLRPGLFLMAMAVSGVWISASAQAQNASSMLGGWLKTTPSPQDMLRGKDPRMVQQLAHWAEVLRKDPDNVTALDNAGYICLEFSRDKRTPLTRWSDWQLLAAKNLERAIQLNPRDFYAWHNYGQLNFEAGDLWMIGDHSNARRAVLAFSEAISLKPTSARSFMGRGFAYVEMNDAAHANADFQTALRLDPSLRGDMQREISGIRQQKAQEIGARGTVQTLQKMSQCDALCQSITSSARQNAVQRANEAERRGDLDVARMIRNEYGIP
jgi:tetratricopeptide (TPR) repeat protein